MYRDGQSVLALLDQHAGSRIVWTPQVEELGNNVAEWMTLGLPGAMVYGLQRCGKTTALTYMKVALHDYVQSPVNVLHWNIGESNRVPTEAALLRGFLAESGYMLTAHKDRAILMIRLTHYIQQCCDELGTKRVLILVDEAQNLHFPNYGVLIECFNILERMNLRPFILLVGQPELALIPSTVLEENKLHIYGRFFKKVSQFHGAKNSDFSVLLEGFDSESVKADGTILPPLARAIFPEQYDEGWRLARLAVPLSEGLQKILSTQNIKDFRLPMQDFVSALRSVILKLDRDPDLFSGDLVSAAVNSFKDSGLVQTLLAYARLNRG